MSREPFGDVRLCNVVSELGREAMPALRAIHRDGFLCAIEALRTHSVASRRRAAVERDLGGDVAFFLDEASDIDGCADHLQELLDKR